MPQENPVLERPPPRNRSRQGRLAGLFHDQKCDAPVEGAPRDANLIFKSQWMTRFDKVQTSCDTFNDSPNAGQINALSQGAPNPEARRRFQVDRQHISGNPSSEASRLYSGERP